MAGQERRYVVIIVSRKHAIRGFGPFDFGTAKDIQREQGGDIVVLDSVVTRPLRKTTSVRSGKVIV